MVLPSSVLLARVSYVKRALGESKGNANSPPLTWLLSWRQEERSWPIILLCDRGFNAWRWYTCNLSRPAAYALCTTCKQSLLPPMTSNTFPLTRGDICNQYESFGIIALAYTVNAHYIVFLATTTQYATSCNLYSPPWTRILPKWLEGALTLNISYLEQ